MNTRPLHLTSDLAVTPTSVSVAFDGAAPSMPLEFPSRELIHVWSLSLRDAPIDDLLPLLSDDERVRAREFIFKKDHDRYVAVRGWLRRLCGAYLHRAPETLRFRYGAAGKPALTANETGVDLRFNVSHTHDLALLAFCVGREVGVDVEYIDGQVDVMGLAHTCFSDAEQQTFHAHRLDQRLELFFHYWTSKEAYIKALGEGLSIPLQEFTVDVHPETPIRNVLVSNPDGLLFTVHQLAMPASYAAAVAAEGNDWRVQPTIP